jgi:hypothetical protein
LNEPQGQPGSVDIDSLVADLKARAAEATELSAAIHAEPTLGEGIGDQLIADVAANLATMREAAGLPSRGAEQFAERIKRYQQQELS